MSNRPTMRRGCTACVLLFALGIAGCTRLGFEGDPRASALDYGADRAVAPQPDAPLDRSTTSRDGVFTVDAREDARDARENSLDAREDSLILMADLFFRADRLIRKDAIRIADLKRPPDAPIAADHSLYFPDAALPTSPCVSSAFLLGVSGPFAVCQPKAGGGLTQCAAQSVCNLAAGWHFCPASRYRASFGTKPPPPVFATAWLAGCVHDGTAAQAYPPRDGACAVCVQQIAAPGYPVQWNCSGGPIMTMNFDWVGVVSASQCARLGQNILQAGAYWRAYRAELKLPKVICCK